MKQHYKKEVVNWYQNRNILVTGGAGFIGSNLVEHLLLFGARVTVLDDLSSGSAQNLSAIKNEITFIHDTITDQEVCNDAALNQSVIFHCAAKTSVIDSETNQEDYHTANVIGTHNILKAAKAACADSVIFSSSAAVYGNQEEPCTETSPVNPESYYGLTKLIGEVYLRYYHQHHKLNTISLRYFNAYGNRQQPDSGVYALFENKIKKNMPITIYGDGTQTRDFVSVDQIIFSNLMSAYYHKKLAGQILNVASGNSISILELISQLKKQYPTYNENITFVPARNNEILHSSADCSRSKSYFHEI